jgi:hypothetical protein
MQDFFFARLPAKGVTQFRSKYRWALRFRFVISYVGQGLYHSGMEAATANQEK